MSEDGRKVRGFPFLSWEGANQTPNWTWSGAPCGWGPDAFWSASYGPGETALAVSGQKRSGAKARPLEVPFQWPEGHCSLRGLVYLIRQFFLIVQSRVVALFCLMVSSNFTKHLNPQF
jgi:hypothetical protein